MADAKRLTVPTNPARALRELSRRQSGAPPEPDKDEENTTILQRDKPTDLPTDQQANKQINYQSNRPTNQDTNKSTINQTDQLTNSITDRPTDQSVGNSPPAPLANQRDKGRQSDRTGATVREEIHPQRADGRTLRVRQETADRTMVTSLRLAVGTIEQLDEYCWRHRQRKQDVVQEALDLYFTTMDAER